MAFIIEPSGHIAVAIFEDGEYWTGSYKHDMSKSRVATDEEVAAFDAERERRIRAGDAYKAQFGITNFGYTGPKKQPKQYAAMVAADKLDPKAFDRFVAAYKA
jgi:hypothetical protein